MGENGNEGRHYVSTRETNKHSTFGTDAPQMVAEMKADSARHMENVREQNKANNSGRVATEATGYVDPKNAGDVAVSQIPEMQNTSAPVDRSTPMNAISPTMAESGRFADDIISEKGRSKDSFLYKVASAFRRKHPK